MPNWCNNELTIEANPEIITKITEIANSNNPALFTWLKPDPSGEYGVEWCENNWGTKSEAFELAVMGGSDTEITVSFDTAWCPPTELYQTLKDMDGVHSVSAFYREDGMEISGYL